jgi:hypothetical protein
VGLPERRFSAISHSPFLDYFRIAGSSAGMECPSIVWVDRSLRYVASLTCSAIRLNLG